MKYKLEKMDRGTEKLLNMYGEPRPESNLSRIYLPRDMEGKRLIGVKNYVEGEKINIVHYGIKSN